MREQKRAALAHCTLLIAQGRSGTGMEIISQGITLEFLTLQHLLLCYVAAVELLLALVLCVLFGIQRISL